MVRFVSLLNEIDEERLIKVWRFSFQTYYQFDNILKQRNIW